MGGGCMAKSLKGYLKILKIGKTPTHLKLPNNTATNEL